MSYSKESMFWKKLYRQHIGRQTALEERIWEEKK